MADMNEKKNQWNEREAIRKRMAEQEARRFLDETQLCKDAIIGVLLQGIEVPFVPSQLSLKDVFGMYSFDLMAKLAEQVQEAENRILENAEAFRKELPGYVTKVLDDYAAQPEHGVEQTCKLVGALLDLPELNGVFYQKDWEDLVNQNDQEERGCDALARKLLHTRRATREYVDRRNDQFIIRTELCALSWLVEDEGEEDPSLLRVMREALKDWLKEHQP